MPSSMCCPRACYLPPERPDYGLLGHGFLMLFAPYTHLVYPAAQVGGACHVRADRDHPVGNLRQFARYGGHYQAEGLLGSHTAGVALAEVVRYVAISGISNLGLRPIPSIRLVSAHIRAAGVFGGILSHSPPNGTFNSSRNCSICLSESTTEWFCGSPMEGSRQPLSV